MPTDAPDGNINAYVVQGRRPDHTTPKAPKVKTHEPAAKEEAPAAKVSDDKPKSATTAKSAEKKSSDKG